MDLGTHVLSALFVLRDLRVQLIDRLLLLIDIYCEVFGVEAIVWYGVTGDAIYAKMMQGAYRAKALFQVIFDGRQLHTQT